MSGASAPGAAQLPSLLSLNWLISSQGSLATLLQ
jgi:hypothetical protein